MTRVAHLLPWIVIGIALAVTFHYMLYRMTLPLKPFIYQAF